MTRFHETRIEVRLTLELKDATRRCVRRRGRRYDSESHFVRCAIIRLLRDEGFWSDRHA